MDTKYYFSLKDGVIDGSFYIESYHGVEKCNEIMANDGICIDEELHQHCLSLEGKIAVNEDGLRDWMEDTTMHMNDGNLAYIPSYDEFVFGIEVKECFTSAIEPYIPTPELPSELELLQEEVLNQSEMMLDLEFRMTTLELGL